MVSTILPYICLLIQQCSLPNINLGECSLAWGHPCAVIAIFMPHKLLLPCMEDKDVTDRPHKLLLSCMEDKDATDSSDAHSEVIAWQDFVLSCLETSSVGVFRLHCPVFLVKI
ncbi:hypothetical protein D1007_28922 [Hordeum vulgare]|nr:hypothetical protein D1007_28922 [Hordeum vulgare]